MQQDGGGGGSGGGLASSTPWTAGFLAAADPPVPVEENCTRITVSRARLLLADLGVEQIADDALRLMLAFDSSGHDLVKGRFHAEEFELGPLSRRVECIPFVGHPEVVVTGTISDGCMSQRQRSRCKDRGRRAGIALAGKDVEDDIGEMNTVGDRFRGPREPGTARAARR